MQEKDNQEKIQYYSQAENTKAKLIEARRQRTVALEKFLALFDDAETSLKEILKDEELAQKPGLLEAARNHVNAIEKKYSRL